MPDLTPTQAIILGLLRNDADAGRLASSNAALAKGSGCCYSNVSDHLRRLTGRGFFRIERAGLGLRVVIFPDGAATASPSAVARQTRKTKRGVRELQSQHLARQQRQQSGEAGIMIRPWGAPQAPARTCQWIEGQPTADDGCKCGAPSAPRASYCPTHLARATVTVLRGQAAA